MGEAKRRKKLDASFGVHDHVIEIQQSEVEKDYYVVLINGIFFDATKCLEKAELLKTWLWSQLKEKPLSRSKFNRENLTVWIYENVHTCPYVSDFEYLSEVKNLKDLIVENNIIFT